MRKLIYSFIGGIVMFSSCEKFLDIKPKGKLIPGEIADYNHLLDNPDIVRFPFLNNNSESFLAYLTDNLEISEGMGKVYYKANNSPNIGNYYAYIFRAPYKNPNLPDYFWESGTYRSMKYFNNVIDGIKSLPDANTPEAKAVLSQAYAGRAWSYLNTTLVYGPMYHPGGDNSTKTIPYLTSSDVSKPVPGLSTQQEIFDYVLSDLHAALPNAPGVTNYPSRPNKAAVLSMLAYYHLFTQKYDSVFYYADAAWKLATKNGVDKVLYDYNQLSYSNPVNILSSAIVSPDNKIHLPNSREILFYRSSDLKAGRISASYPSEEFIQLFDADHDLRYSYYLLTATGYKTTFSGTTYDDGQRIQYYRGAYATGTSYPKFEMTCGFSYPEVLLMRAEANARLNKPGEAMADINLLRKYRLKTGSPDLAIPPSQEATIQLVLEERRRELPIGHIKRFLDLKRYGLETGKPWSKTIIEHRVGTEIYQGHVNSEDFIIPKSNNVLKLNPGWGIPLDERPF